MNKKALGNFGEECAVKYLKSCGYTILAQNYASKYGEVDIIVRDGNTIVFVEVKMRKSADYGTAGQAVNRKKQQKIIRMAQWYMMGSKNTEMSCRFDVIEVYYSTSDRYKLTHIKEAFEV